MYIAREIWKFTSFFEQTSYHTHLQSVPQEKVRVFSESFKDFYSFLLCSDCTFEGLRRNHRFVSVLYEVSDITQH